MKNGFYTLREIERAIKSYGEYKMCECLDAAGMRCTGSMQVHQTPTKWLNTIVNKFVLKPNTKHGAYYIYCYTDARKKSQPDVFPFYIGQQPVELMAEGLPQRSVQPIVIQNDNNERPKDNPLSWAAALEYQTKISKLEIENAELKRRIEELEDELEEVESKGEGGLGEIGKSFLEGALPLAEEWFNQKRRDNLIEFLKLRGSNKDIDSLAHVFLPHGQRNGNGQQQTPITSFLKKRQQPNHADAMANQLIVQRANEFLDTLDDETFERVEQIKIKSGNDLQLFFNILEKQMPDVYFEMSDFIYSNETVQYEEEEESEDEQ